MESRQGSVARVAVALAVLVFASAAWLQPWHALAAHPKVVAATSPPRVASMVKVIGAGFAGEQAWVASVLQPDLARSLALTADGGRTWAVRLLPFRRDDPPTQVRQATGGPILALSAASAYLSPDLGASWVPIALPPGQTSPLGLFFLDPNQGWFQVGSQLWSTNDGSAHWTSLAGAGLPGGAKGPVRFDNPLHGSLAAGGALYETDDGGRLWRLSFEAPAGQVIPASMTAGGGCVLAAFAPPDLTAFPSPDCQTWANGVRLAHTWQLGYGTDFVDLRRWLVADHDALEWTDDGGDSWHVAQLRVPAGDVLDHVARFDRSWWALADDRSGGGGTSVLFHSTDGLRWAPVKVPGLG